MSSFILSTEKKDITPLVFNLILSLGDSVLEFIETLPPAEPATESTN